MNLPKYHGESCNLNSECWTNNCVNNKCTGKADGECYNKDYECGKESFYKDGTCAKYASKNGDCSELKCLFGYECVNINNNTYTCFERFSVKAGRAAVYDTLCESEFSINRTISLWCLRN